MSDLPCPVPRDARACPWGMLLVHVEWPESPSPLPPHCHGWFLPMCDALGSPHPALLGNGCGTWLPRAVLTQAAGLQ